MSRAFVTVVVSVAAAMSVASSALGELRVDLNFRSKAGLRNLYFVSFPYSEPVPDVANSGLSDPCDTAGQGSDGVINADDAICHMWGGGDLAEQVGGFAIQQLSDDGVWSARVAFTSPFLGKVFAGTPFEIDPGLGYLVRAPYNPSLGERDNAFTLRGPCVPAFPGHVYETPDRHLLHLPYDSLLRTVDEILCGVEGVDWMPHPEQGTPDRCEGGLFGQLDGYLFTLSDFENELGRGFRARTLHDLGPFAGLVFGGSDFDLEAGKAYILAVSINAPDTQTQPLNWDPPRGPCPP